MLAISARNNVGRLACSITVNANSSFASIRNGPLTSTFRSFDNTSIRHRTAFGEEDRFSKGSRVRRGGQDEGISGKPFRQPAKGKQSKNSRPAEEDEEDDEDDVMANRKMKGRRGKQVSSSVSPQPFGKPSRDRKRDEIASPSQRGGSSSQSLLRPKDWTKKDSRETPSKKTEERNTKTLSVNYSRMEKASTERKVRPFRAQKVTIPLPQFITVSNLAKALDVKMQRLQHIMSQSGLTDIRPDFMLSFGQAELLAMEFNVTAISLSTSSTDFDIFPRPPPSDPQSLPLRPPVVAIMGHVDHGKTTLLDKLRSASVAAGEAGGITQHVGAFSVEVKGMSSEGDRRTITFLDTPGHAAFTQMRSRGAKVTDIVVLVVAADDGVMPQTKEVIKMVQDIQEEEGRKGSGSGGLQLLVAISKVDRADAEPAKVKSQLLGENVILEEFGGDVPCIEISGKTGQGLDELQDNLVVISELNELRAERSGPAEGYVIESRIEKGFGNTAIVLVKRGSLKVGDLCVAGASRCKVRRLMDSSGSIDIQSAEPGQALLTTGWRELPKAGDLILGVESEGGQDAEEMVKKCIDTRLRIEASRKMIQDVEAINEGRRGEANEREKAERQSAEVRRLTRAARLSGEEFDLSELEAKVAAADSAETTTVASAGSDKLELRLIVKADVSGTVEAVIGAISGIGNNEVYVKIVHSGVGDPTEGDLAMAKAVGGHILGFNVQANRSLLSSAQSMLPAINIHCDDVIYRLMSYVTEQCVALLPPIYESRILGEATIQQVFSINVRGNTSRNVAGCRVTNGTISKNQKVRIVRAVNGEGKQSRGKDKKESDGKDKMKYDSAGRQIMYEGRLDSLKQIKKEVDEMRKGTECGMSFEDDFQDFRAGDLVQSYHDEKVVRTL